MPAPRKTAAKPKAENPLECAKDEPCVDPRIETFEWRGCGITRCIDCGTQKTDKKD